MRKITNGKIAFETPEKIADLQEKLLRDHIRYCKSKSPFYRRALRGASMPSGNNTAEILAALPLTDKRDLAEFNQDFFAVPAGAVVDIVMSSGTTGIPTKIPYTEHDLRRLAYNEEKSFSGCGLTGDDIVLLTCTLDRCFIAGLAYFLGVRNLGAAAIRNGHDTMGGYAEILRRLAPTAMVGVPSFIRKLGHYLRDRGMDPCAATIRRIVAIGEPVRGADMKLLKSGKEIETLWGARVYSTYASSETVTSFCECTAQRGGHLHPDLALVEIINERGDPAPEGAIGEIVITPLGVEGMPLLRFRTGDLSFLMNAPCPCGRNTPRLGPIAGRRAQMLKVKGTTLYPPAILAALEEMEEVSDFYISVESETFLSDMVTAHVTLNEKSAVRAEEIARRLQARLRVKPRVKIEPETELRRIVYRPESRKPVRFVDYRVEAAGAACGKRH